MERDLPERNLQIFSNTYVGSRLKERLQELEELNAKEEEDYEISLVEWGIRKVIKENVQNEKFQPKRWLEYEKFWKQKLYTRTLVWIQFPDGFLIQGTFGALEKLQDVYEFVRENIFDKKRKFTLYEPTPRKLFTEYDKTLNYLGMVP